MSVCEDCGDSVRRRFRCFHCGLFVCRWCWHHVHQCEPGHRRDDCTDLRKYKRLGARLLDRLRALTLKAAGEPGDRL